MLYAVVLMVAGVLLIVVGVPASRRKLPRAWWLRVGPVGLVADHQASGPLVVAGGVAGLAGGLLSLPPQGAVDWGFVGGVAMLALTGAGILWGLYVTRRERR